MFFPLYLPEIFILMYYFLVFYFHVLYSFPIFSVNYTYKIRRFKEILYGPSSLQSTWFTKFYPRLCWKLNLRIPPPRSFVIRLSKYFFSVKAQKNSKLLQHTVSAYYVNMTTQIEYGVVTFIVYTMLIIFPKSGKIDNIFKRIWTKHNIVKKRIDHTWLFPYDMNV